MVAYFVIYLSRWPHLDLTQRSYIQDLKRDFLTAAGKSGAIIGAFVIGRYFTLATLPLQTALAILACTNAVGFCCTIFVPETKQMTLEDASSISESIFGKFLRKRGIVQVGAEKSLKGLR